MSSDSLHSLGNEVKVHIDDRDPDWVLINELGALCVSALPGQMLQIRDDQVRNNAGGYVFVVSDETRVRRFLILGSAGGTYYSTEKELTLENVAALKDIIHRGKASLILDEIREISLAGRNLKQEPIMMALALCARYKVSELGKKSRSKTGELYQAYLAQMHKDAMRLVSEVCRIPTHLFSFIKYCEMVAADELVVKENKKTESEGVKEDAAKKEVAKRKVKSTGWGRLMRKVIQSWYTNRSTDELAMHLTKYAKREGWSHRDVFRLAHPIAPHNKEHIVYEQLFHFAVKGEVNTRKRRLPEGSEDGRAAKEKYTEEQLRVEEESKALTLVEKFKSLSKDTPEEEVARAIRENGLVREHIPTELLNSPEVWKALLEKMPMTAMIRNLGKMESIHLLDDEECRMKIVDELSKTERLKKAKVHPIQLLLAHSVYNLGKGVKGSLKWDAQPVIASALEAAFYKSFVNVPPTNKRFCLAFDVSGSMGSVISGTCLSARYASAAIGLNLLKVEQNVECIGFCHELTELPYDGDWTLERVDKHMNSLQFGMTNCALPMIWAEKKKKHFDVFIVFTDNETYFGDIHPSKALKRYRSSSGIEARLIVCGMTSTNFSIADPEDSGMLDVVGFDSAVPQLIAEFVLGNI